MSSNLCVWPVRFLTGAVLIVLLVVSLLPAGCETVGYGLSLLRGQIGIIIETRPIEDVIADGSVTPEQADKLRLILEVRQYAIDVIGLDGGQSYTQYYDTHGAPLAYNLLASAKDSLTLMTWTFPIFGTFKYLGFFEREQASDLADRLRDGGLDVYVREVDAYSLLGHIPDPVRSPMLERDESQLVDVLIHELLHNTIWKPGDTDFNESLAVFVGRAGALCFFEEEYGPDSEQAVRALESYEDSDAFVRFVYDLIIELEGLYGSDLSREEKIARREDVFQAARGRVETEFLPTLHDPDRYSGLADLPTNNAWLLLTATYYNEDRDLFRQVFEMTGRDWPASMSVFAEAATVEDSMQFLRDWLIAAGADVDDSKRRVSRKTRAASAHLNAVAVELFLKNACAPNPGTRSCPAKDRMTIPPREPRLPAAP